MPQTPLIAHEALRVEHDPALGRFSLFDAETFIGFLGYVEEKGVLDLQHTIIKEEFSRRGYARALVTIVLERVWAWDKRVVPTCSYVAEYLDLHPQYAWLAQTDAGGALPDAAGGAASHGRHAL